MEFKHILAIGSHPGDMELSCGAVLAAHRKKGDKVTILHLINKQENYYQVQQKAIFNLKIEAEDAANVIGANVLFGNLDSSKPDGFEEGKFSIANIIRKLRPTTIITHWKNSVHYDHKVTHDLILDAFSLSSSPYYKLNYPVFDGVRSLYFAEHWADKDEFDPYIYINITKFMKTWLEMINCYEQYKYNIPYIEYHQALAKFRGIESHFPYACTFAIHRSIKQLCHELSL